MNKEQMIKQYKNRANSEKESGTILSFSTCGSEIVLISIENPNWESGYYFQDWQADDLLARYEKSNNEVFGGEMDVKDLILADLVNW